MRTVSNQRALVERAVPCHLEGAPCMLAACRPSPLAPTNSQCPHMGATAIGLPPLSYLAPELSRTRLKARQQLLHAPAVNDILGAEPPLDESNHRELIVSQLVGPTTILWPSWYASQCILRSLRIGCSVPCRGCRHRRQQQRACSCTWPATVVSWSALPAAPLLSAWTGHLRRRSLRQRARWQGKLTRSAAMLKGTVAARRHRMCHGLADTHCWMLLPQPLHDVKPLLHSLACPTNQLNSHNHPLTRHTVAGPPTRVRQRVCERIQALQRVARNHQAKQLSRAGVGGEQRRQVHCLGATATGRICGREEQRSKAGTRSQKVRQSFGQRLQPSNASDCTCRSTTSPCERLTPLAQPPASCLRRALPCMRAHLHCPRPHACGWAPGRRLCQPRC